MFTVSKLSILHHFWLSEVDKYGVGIRILEKFFECFLYSSAFQWCVVPFPWRGESSHFQQMPLSLSVDTDESEGLRMAAQRVPCRHSHLAASPTACLLYCMLPDLQLARHTFPVTSLPHSPHCPLVLPSCKSPGAFCTVWENHSLSSVSSCCCLWQSTPRNRPFEK